jgi:sugar phosphate isomerase/epimerase
MIRIMSYGILRDRPAGDQLAQERFRRLREIKKMFDDAGVTPVHENCMNYGGMGWKYTLELIENVPGLKLVFDTANPPCTLDYASGSPEKLQSTWEFYEHVRQHVAYVHIKDCRFLEFTTGIFNKAEFTWPGDGDGDVVRIVRDLVAGGYDGGISMEPHLSVVFHEEGGQTEADVRLRTYVEYGKRFEKILADCGVDPAKLR